MNIAKPIAAALLLVAAGAAAWAWVHVRTPADARVRGAGTIEATEVIVAPKVAARIAELFVDDGDRVQVGQPIAVLACDAMEDQVAQANAQVAQAKAAVLQARARDRQASLEDEPLRVQRAFAEKERARTRHLFQVSGATEAALDQADTNVTALDKQLDQIGAANDVARAGVAVAAAQVVVAEDALRLARTQLDECKIESPIAGVVMRRDHEPGELALPGTALVELGRLDEVYTWIYVPNEEVGRVRVGQSVDVVADAYPQRHFAGRVAHVEEQAEFTPKTIQTKEDRTRLVFGVKVVLSNVDGALLPGMPVEAVLDELDGAARAQTR